MGEYTSYYLYQKYEKRGVQDWIPCYPNTYSISGDSQNPMPLVVKEEEDVECGAQPCDEIIRWSEIPITQDYICDDCEVGYLYRWVQCDPAAYTYFGDYKYDILCEEVSEDNGQTWSATTNTKVSSASTGVADKKVKITFDNNDTFATSCGSDNGVWESFLTNRERYWSQDVPNHLTNLYFNKLGGFTLSGPIKNVKKVEFSDCVFEIGDRYRGYATFNQDIAESGQALSGVNHNSSCAEWGMRELVLPPNLRWIGGYAFADNKIRTLTLPSTVESIGYVRNWDYDGVHVSVDRSKSGAFAFNKRLVDVNLNEGLKSIGSGDFMGCTALEVIEIPSTVERMDKDIFSGCTNLKQIIFKSETPPETMCDQGGRTFTVECDTHNGFSANSDTYVYVPCGSKSAYTEWISDLPDEKVVEYGGSCPSIPSIDDMYVAIVTYKVGNNTYSIHRGLKSDPRVFSADTAAFDEWADNFYDADELTIGRYCWPVWTMDSQQHLYGTNIAGSYNKLTINTAGGLVVTGDSKEIVVGMPKGFIEYSFNDMVNLERFKFESGNTEVVDLSWSFSGCNSLTSVTIDGLASFRGSAFATCENLEDVYINYDESVLVARPKTDVVDKEKYKPFGNCHPNLKIHVPCKLYFLYRADSYWSGFTIVRDSSDCTPLEPGYDDQLFEITKQEWNYQISGTTSWYDSNNDRVDGYYESYQSRVKDSEIIFNVINKAIRLEFDYHYTSFNPKVYKDGVEVTFTSTGSYPASYEYKDDMRGEYGVTHTFRIVRTANTYSDASPAIDNLKIMYQAG